jgi:hypothetical protein
LPSNQPGWTVVERAENGYYCGTFSLKTESDSEIVYRTLHLFSLNCSTRLATVLEKLVQYSERGTRLLVHRFDTSESEPELLECNCHAIYAVPHIFQSRSLKQVQRSLVMPQQPVYSYPPAPMAPAPAMPAYGWPQPVPSMQGLTEGFQTLAVGQEYYQPGYYPTPMDPACANYQYTNGATYVRNSYGLPVNTTNGGVASECREVHISNIQYQVHKKDLTQQISKIATPITLEYHVDHAGKFKGTAVVTFDSGDRAALVVAQLDKKLIKGKKVKVRLGKQTTPVSPTPVVVDGSYEY